MSEQKPARASLVHTSDFTKLMIHKNVYIYKYVILYTELKLSAIMQWSCTIYVEKSQISWSDKL